MENRDFFNTYFGTELRFSLINHVHEDKSFISLVIPDGILTVLTKLNMEIVKYLNIKPEEERYFYKEEVEEILRLAKHFLKSLEDKKSSEHEDDMVEIFHHLIHLCHVSLNGGKVLHLSVGYDDSAFC